MSPETDIVAVATIAAKECVRQQVGIYQLKGVIGAYIHALQFQGNLPNMVDLYHMAESIEERTEGRYRLVPVTFANGGDASKPRDIPANIDRLYALLNEDTDPYEWTRSFLSIHPFIDGNGRLAWILYNWLHRTLHNPVPLPDFKF